ncbi:MAG: DUF4251 domain-containing protein [Sphingobacteriales bacterium]|nr:DUF4251 domain-containing protein [Sphingobacteriales bacterium]
MKKISLVILLSLFLLTSCLTQKEQIAYQNSISKMLAKNQFTFEAQRANPMSVNLINPQLLQLDGSYSVKISADTLKCYLPYFGVAQQASYGTHGNSLNFITTHFTLQKSEEKNGNYLINLQIEGQPLANKMSLSISPSGNTILTVNSVNRDAISFFGDLKL